MSEVSPAAVSSELLERAFELAALDEAFDVVRGDSRGTIVLVGGEAGVGKTTLLRRFAESRENSVRILWASCDPLFAPRPLGPLLAVAEETGGELEEVIAAGSMPHDVASSLARELCVRSPTILVLEDVHWADEATLDTLILLVRRLEAVPALVVASYRDEGLDRSHPLRRVLGELATGEVVRRLKLAPLSSEAVARLAASFDVDALELYRKTAGNPFFVVEALAVGAGEIPALVRDAVLARAAPLSFAARDALDAVAIASPPADLPLLRALLGEQLAGLDQCLASGMLAEVPGGVAFRHELARLAIEEAVPLNRKTELHATVLRALADRPASADLTRLAHHAEGAGDAVAVLRLAPAAAGRAAAMGAHREAAAQYARALRFGEALSPAGRADLLERRADACYLTDQNGEAIESMNGALDHHRRLGDPLKEGDALRRLSEFLWCPGRTGESEQAARAAVELLETQPPGHELARAYAGLAGTCVDAGRLEEAVRWGVRALELAEHLDDSRIAVNALAAIGACEFAAEGVGTLRRSLEKAEQAGLEAQIGKVYVVIAGAALRARCPIVAKPYVDAGIDYCSDRGLELFRLYLIAHRARLELDMGRWADAADSAEAVLRIERTSTMPRIIALVVLALVRARRGDTGHSTLLAQAWRLSEPTGELPRLGPVAAARAETAWLEGDRDAVAAATEKPLALAFERRSGLLIGELVTWRRRAGLDPQAPPGASGPYLLQLDGKPVDAAGDWAARGLPYEAALALSEASSEELVRRSLDELHELDARPAAAIVTGRLRARGVRRLPRGPRPTTRQNPWGLTVRELEVLGLVAEGLPNVRIAARLVLSERTVDHHVAAVLRKLGVRTRAEASLKAARLELTQRS